VTQVSAAPREKVVRMAIATLRNLNKQGSQYNERMIECGLLKTLDQLKERKWGDADIGEDILAVRDSLLRDFRELSSLERYEKEITSGKLDWGFLHTEKFWKEHVMEFEREDFKLIKLLAELLSSENVITVSVACHDLGEFVRFYPNGKSLCNHLSVKPVVMNLLSHADQDVQKSALQCVSKMMVNNWEFVQ